MLMHPTLYDVKGIGGGSLVVAAVSVRDNSEVYACIDDPPVAETPDWLLDWLLADFEKYRVARDKELAKKHEAKAIALRMSDGQRCRLRKKKLPDGFDIAEEDIYDFLRCQERNGGNE
jgi:hypothetical protein